MGNIAIRAAKVVIKAAESVPGVGHIVAFVHWLRGDRAAASGAMWSATRSTLVVAAGVAGMCLCGPTGAVVAAVGGGLALDALRSLGNRQAQGTAGALCDVSRDIAAWRFPLFSGGRLLFLLAVDAASGLGAFAFLKEVCNADNILLAIRPLAVRAANAIAGEVCRLIWELIDFQ